MKKTKYEQIKEQQKKARNKEILYRVDQIFKYKPDITADLLLEAVTHLHLYGCIYPEKLQKLLVPGYKIVETTPNKELTNNERYEILKKALKEEE